MLARNRFRLLRRTAGFSLVEILLVILIILMLAGAMVMYVLPQQEGAQKNTTLLKLGQINKALSLYKLNLGTYPSEEEGGLDALLRKPAYEDERRGEKWRGPYLELGATIDDAWGHRLRYEIVDKALTEEKTGPDYRLFSVGPDGQPDTDDDIKLFKEEEQTPIEEAAPPPQEP
jgi:general secretion pathway protein G